MRKNPVIANAVDDLENAIERYNACIDALVELGVSLYIEPVQTPAGNNTEKRRLKRAYVIDRLDYIAK